MIETRPGNLPPQAPSVPTPPPFVERRQRHRRTEDRIAHQETVLLARALDVLASDASAEERLAGLLRLLARTVGARRAAVVADGIERRAAVAVDPGEDQDAAAALAEWLDANAPRSRAKRAASGRAPISFLVAADRRGEAASAERVDAAEATVAADARDEQRPVEARHFAMLPIDGTGGVALGFEFARAAEVDRVADRLPPTMARHAGVALALVANQLAAERELAAMRARDVERSTFVSTVAHELRSPLTGLRGYLELILDGQVPDPADEREFLDRSRSIVETMDELVGDLLELSRLESGSIRLEIGPFSIAEAASQVASNLLPIALGRDIRLTTALPPRLHAATGDRRRVEQILTNLTANALKFTTRGGEVEIAGHVAGQVAVLIVRDDGDGIPSDERDRIFERFQRLAGHDGVTGTGLGLPIARDLARRMGGDLDVASVPGSGSAFVLVLPGPAGADGRTIAAALARTLEREEVELEERAVRRAIGLVRVLDRSGDAVDHGADARPSAAVERSNRQVVAAERVRATAGPVAPTPVPERRLHALPDVRDDRSSPA